MDGWYRTREQSGTRNLQLKCYWVSSRSLWKVKRGKMRQRTRIVLVGKSSNTWDAPSEAFPLLPVVLTESRANTCSICQEPVLVLLISEQHVPLQEGIRFPFMFTCCNSIWRNVQTWAVSLGQCREDAEKGNRRDYSMLEVVWDLLRSCGR